MNILHLTLKKPWFDLISSGEKREEYRQPGPWIESRVNPDRSYDLIEFRQGYGRTRPVVWVEFAGYHHGPGNPAWGAQPGQTYLVISLGPVWTDFDAFMASQKFRCQVCDFEFKADCTEILGFPVWGCSWCDATMDKLTRIIPSQP